MQMSKSLLDRLTDVLQQRAGRSLKITRTEPISGGSINDAYRLDTSAGAFFVKVNAADRFPSLFEAEADGLARLRGTGTLRVPEVLAFGEAADDTFLLLEHFENATRSAEFWETFGRSLAALHRHSNAQFGLQRDNYIGSLAQVNTPTADWPSFFIHQRLEPLLKLARDGRKVEAGMAFRFERLFGKLEQLFPKEAPALLHGDLWNGNFLCADGAPVLFDPAVYYGHREMDLAMTKLFGGFEPGFYRAYNEAWPLEQGWEERTDLCNLYPLMVHVNLFGGNYVQQVEAILRRYV